MKLRRWIGTGIILCLLGAGITAIASTQINFEEEFDGLILDPMLEKKEQTFGEIVKITYEGTDENLDIIYAEEENSLSYYESEKLTYEIFYDENLKELRIKQNHSFSFFNFSFMNKKATLTIHSELESLDMHASAGNIKLKDLNINTASLDVGAGNIVLDNTSTSSLFVKSNAGNVTILSLKTHLGDFDVKAGNLKITDSSILTAKIMANAGNVNINQTSLDEITARLNAGNLTFVGDIFNQGDLKLDAGNLKLTFLRDRSAYTLNGEGEGKSIVLYKVSAGNSSIKYSE